MIKKEEIEAKSHEFKIHTAHVERDYVFSWLLVGIYTVSPLKDILILKGGNCFRKAYFANTRFSADLDFSIQNALDDNYLGEELNKVCDFVHDATGIIFEKDRNHVEEKFSISREMYVVSEIGPKWAFEVTNTLETTALLPGGSIIVPSYL